MKIEFQNNTLKINNRELELIDEIKDVIEFDDFLVIRTDTDKSSTNENVYGINKNGEIKWQIEKISHLSYNDAEFKGIIDPYTTINKISENKVQLINWDNTHFQIDANSGKILTNPMKSRIGKRTW